MATYRNIASTETDPEAPMTAQLAKAWAENPTAIAEGAISAPRVAIGALQRLQAGSDIRARNDATQTNTTTTFALAFQCDFLQAGQIRVTFLHRSAVAGSCEVIVRRVINGSNLDVTFSAGVGASIARSTDVQVLPGARIQILFRQLTSGTAEINFIRLQTNGEDLYPGVYQLIEGNTFN